MVTEADGSVHPTKTRKVYAYYDDSKLGRRYYLAPGQGSTSDISKAHPYDEDDSWINGVERVYAVPEPVKEAYGKPAFEQIAERLAAPLPEDSTKRKEYPLYEGLLKYFPDALAEVAHVSFVGNQKHNPGQPLHWSRDKSSDHKDCIARHLLQAGGFDHITGVRHSAELAWRALANLQIEIEKDRK